MKLPSLKFNLRTRYRILAVLLPTCWLRNDPCDPEWDNWLWDVIINDKIQVVGSHAVITDDEVAVWTANYPYASGTDYCQRVTKSCSRATALLLNSRLDRAKMMAILRGTNSKENFQKYGIS